MSLPFVYPHNFNHFLRLIKDLSTAERQETSAESQDKRPSAKSYGGGREKARQGARCKVQEPLDNKAKVSVKYVWNWVSVCTLCSFGLLVKKKKKRKKNKDDQTEGKTKKPLAQKQYYQ
jgi:hypothetical protein